MSTGLLVMAYGTPSGPDRVEEYYTHIRRGRPPEPAQLDELVGRYEAIGGISPMASRTRAQVQAVTVALQDLDPDRWTVRLGQKHAAPFIEDGTEELIAAGVDHIVGLVLTPHYSGASVGQYQARAIASAGSVPFTGIDSWHLEPDFIDFQVKALRTALEPLPERTHVLFTAHSLPRRVLVDDPYADQLHESAAATAARAGLGRWAGWGLGWQSAGRTPEPWQGPDILEIVGDLADTGRSDGLLVVPQGFTADHLEVLYDLDIETAAAAERVELAFGRTQVVNDDPAVMGALARRAVAAAAVVTP